MPASFIMGLGCSTHVGDIEALLTVYQYDRQTCSEDQPHGTVAGRRPGRRFCQDCPFQLSPGSHRICDYEVLPAACGLALGSLDSTLLQLQRLAVCLSWSTESCQPHVANCSCLGPQCIIHRSSRKHGGPSRTRVHDHAGLHDRADAGLHLPARCRRAGDLRIVALHDLGRSLHHAKHAGLLAACLQRPGPYQRQMVRTR